MMCVARSAMAFLVVSILSGSAMAENASPTTTSLNAGLKPFLQMLSGGQKTFELTGELQIRIDGRQQPIRLRLARFDDEAFDLSLTHTDYAVEIRRRADSTAMVLPLHKVAFVGTGEVPERLRLSPLGIGGRLVSPQSSVMPAVTLLSNFNPGVVDTIVAMAGQKLKVERDAASGTWMLAENSPLTFPEPGTLDVTADFGTVHLQLTNVATPAEDSLDGLKIVELSRTELERTLLRGVHRATEILAPAPVLKNPPQRDRKVSHGELRWIDGQRVAILQGTPEQIGTAHGQLLKQESLRCIESVLCSFGTAHVIRTGHWFRHDLEAAYARLSPFIPERHKQETQALAAALDLPGDTLNVLNVFPEMFHCSGFAVFNSATKDGKLYHGRVLDYMTTIGLQDAATTFIVNPEGYLPFANVGYASFVGSVSGMNIEAISLGEMGGRGEGNWDGAPMATLMRRALEECSTLDEVMRLWTDSPRTCEYYYVFADGKTNRAVGVAALPESIEFIHPGQSHERLGAGIPDAVVLSAGSRLETLRSRVTEKHGQIDAEIGQWLMSRPVAMQSNLHNVLFVPQDGILYVANASHSKPAAEQPYVKLNLAELLGTVARKNVPAAAR
ncbi:MAG: C45 family peptidase [Fuerstiella sp.]